VPAALRQARKLEELTQADAVLGVDRPWFHTTSLAHRYRAVGRTGRAA